MKYSKIIGVGSYLPEKVLTNADLEKIVNTDDKWIRERTGIEQRHVAEDGELCSDLAVAAASDAIKKAGVNVSDIGLIIVATSTPDKLFPSTACIVQQKLGVSQGAAFDIVAACSGFIYALSVADKYVSSGAVDSALVIGAETYSRILNWNDRNTCVLFGDGAGAVVLKADNKPGIIATDIASDGRYDDLLGVSWGASQGYDNLTDENRWFEMRGNEVFKHAVKTLAKMIVDTLENNGYSKDTPYWLVPHQANIRIIQSTAKKVGLDPARVIITVGKHANTSAASIPLALDAGLTDGRIKENELVILEAFGGGLTWGSALVKF
ncbi:MAG: ketoacyl-ACP synthase III [Gammaproteobacteria bacterium]|nr:MAG: ketoacyl-ACP synthase III [Gammaproteobacteria bacterium]